MYFLKGDGGNFKCWIHQYIHFTLLTDCAGIYILVLGYNSVLDFHILGKWNQYIHVSRQFPAIMVTVVRLGLHILVKPCGSVAV